MENRYRSLFWPIILIGIGVIWLLANFNLIPPTSLGALLRLWPVLLIVAGLDILLGRGNRWLGALLGLLVVGFIVVLLVAAPNLNIGGAPIGREGKTEQFSAPLEGATSASFDLDIAEYSTRLNALSGSNQLIDASIGHVEEVDFRVSGEQQKTVYLGLVDNVSQPFNWFTIPGQNLHWEIGLNPDVPWDVNVDGGSGSANLDFSELELTELTGNFGSGSVQISLPASEDLQARIDSGSGSITIEAQDAANLLIELDSGSGSVNIRLPGNTGLRVELQDGGSGSLNVPNGVELIDGDGDDDSVWKAPTIPKAKASSFASSTRVRAASISASKKLTAFRGCILRYSG